MTVRDKFDFSALTLDEKCILAHELLLEVEREAQNAPVSEDLIAELERRSAAVRAGTEKTYSWEDVQARLWPQRP
jgi:putative addiction module component (TIGR02574 family)